ncbi:Serine/threonine-protein kinase smg1 [Hypoxylon texense]
MQAVEEIPATCGGMHTPIAKASNVDGGVTTELGLVDKDDLDAKKPLTMSGGGRFKEAYKELAEHGLAVVGNREGNVGDRYMGELRVMSTLLKGPDSVNGMFDEDALRKSIITELYKCYNCGGTLS